MKSADARPSAVTELAQKGLHILDDPLETAA
jgi:hypothetical protein